MFRSFAIIFALCMVSARAHAALEGRAPTTPGGMDYQAVYDTDLDVTWLTNADLALTQSFGINPNLINLDGSMLWSTANDWISALNAASYLGYNDWRLPSTLQPEPSCSIQGGGGGYGYNCTSEMGHLWYVELGGVQGMTLAQNHNANYDLFTNIETTNNGYYWSGEYAYYTPFGWVFYYLNGYQDAKTKNSFGWVLPVRTGDVAPPDTDGDGIPDVTDNCTLVPNANQRDTNGDGYGNLCDPDFDNNGTVNINDFNRLKARLGISPVVDIDTDLDGNGAVNVNDLNRLKSFLGKPPGPSGLHPDCPPTCP